MKYCFSCHKQKNIGKIIIKADGKRQFKCNECLENIKKAKSTSVKHLDYKNPCKNTKVKLKT